MKEIQIKLMKKLVPNCERDFLDNKTVDAELVFDIIRELSDPPMTKEEFNQISDELGL
jgi:hypothetical protein